MRDYAKLFHGLRVLVAEHNILSTFQLGMGEIMSDVVLKRYVRPLMKEYKRTGDEDYMDKAQNFKQFADKGSDKFQVWDKYAAKAIWKKLREYHKENDFQDSMQYIASRLLKEIEKDKDIFKKRKIDPLDPKIGPWDLVAAFSAFVSWKTHDYMRSEYYRNHINPDDDTGDGEGREKTMDRVPDEGGSESIDRAVLRETYSDMVKYLSRQLHGDDVDMGIFKSWMDAVDKYGIGKVEFKNDVYKKLDKWGYVDDDIPYATAAWKWKRIRKLVSEFFEKELGMRLTDRQKKKLKLATADVVAVEYMKRAVARWVLDIS